MTLRHPPCFHCHSRRGACASTRRGKGSQLLQCQNTQEVRFPSLTSRALRAMFAGNDTSSPNSQLPFPLQHLPQPQEQQCAADQSPRVAQQGTHLGTFREVDPRIPPMFQAVGVSGWRASRPPRPLAHLNLKFPEGVPSLRFPSSALPGPDPLQLESRFSF